MRPLIVAPVPSSLPYKERGPEKAIANSYELDFCSHILLPNKVLST